MPLASQREVLRLKLTTVPAPLLRNLARSMGISASRAGEIIKDLLSGGLREKDVDEFIRRNYAAQVARRQAEISDHELLRELKKVDRFHWGVVQGQLDNKIQVEYVRRYHRYDLLLANIEKSLYESVKEYVICTWYNHWTTVIIEDLISTHTKVVPTLKNRKGIDLFFDGQPFDLKITYLPATYPTPDDAVSNPRKLAIWLYENQGAQRFGADNRLFVVVHDTRAREDSWKIKRDIDFVRQNIDKFFERERVSESDEVVFTFNRDTYTAIGKVLLVTR
jgi:hypothetical protein